MGLVLMLKHLQSLANSENSLMALYSVRIVTKPLSPEPRCVKTHGIFVGPAIDSVQPFSLHL